MNRKPIETVLELPHPLVFTALAVALAWVLRQDGVCAIPQSGKPEHVRENRGALDVRLTPRDLAELDDAFPAPARKQPLASL